MNRQGNAMVSIYGQEKDNATAGLAKMNLVLHQKGTGEIKSHSTLTSPQYLDEYGQLRKFDFIVMKRWLSLLIRDNGVCEYALAA